MSTPWSRAHERLIEQLPVRRVERTRPPERLDAERGGAPRAVQIRGRKFDSVLAASLALKVHRRRIYQWIETGVARYL